MNTTIECENNWHSITRPETVQDTCQEFEEESQEEQNNNTRVEDNHQKILWKWYLKLNHLSFD